MRWSRSEGVVVHGIANLSFLDQGIGGFDGFCWLLRQFSQINKFYVVRQLVQRSVLSWRLCLLDVDFRKHKHGAEDQYLNTEAQLNYAQPAPFRHRNPSFQERTDQPPQNKDRARGPWTAFPRQSRRRCPWSCRSTPRRGRRSSRFSSRALSSSSRC